MMDTTISTSSAFTTTIPAMIDVEVICFDCLEISKAKIPQYYTGTIPASCPRCHSTNVEIVSGRLGAYIRSLQQTIDHLSVEWVERKKHYRPQKRNRYASGS